MSGTSEVLQEYLVKLGFKVDQGDYKKFTDSLGTVGKRVLGVGVAVAGVVAGVEAAAAAFAYSMRKVYFDSQLAQSSVKNLQSLSYAGQQVGISAESMTGAIHNMAQQLRLNPGLRGVIESFGVKVEGRDVSDVMTDYVKALGSMPEFQAAQFAGMFGMDPDTYHQFRNNADAIIAKQKEMKDVYKSLGTDMDEAAKMGLHYANSLDNVKMHLGALENSILAGVLPAFDKFTAGIVHNMDIVTKWLNLPVREGFGGALGIAMGLKSAATDGGVGAHLTPYARARMREQGVRFGASAPGTPLSAAERAKMGVRNAPTGAGLGAIDWGTGGNSWDAPSGLHKNERNNNPGNIEYGPWAIAHGATGSDGRFAIFPDLATGYGAAQALLSDYGKGGTNTVGGIIGKWAPSTDHNDVGSYGGFVAKQMGVGVNDKLDMSNPAVISQLTRYIAQYEGMSPAGLAQAPQINNTFHITGNNATDIANKVAGAQSRTYADALRNGQGVVR